VPGAPRSCRMRTISSTCYGQLWPCRAAKVTKPNTCLHHIYDQDSRFNSPGRDGSSPPSYEVGGQVAPPTAANSHRGVPQGLPVGRPRRVDGHRYAERVVAYVYRRRYRSLIRRCLCRNVHATRTVEYRRTHYRTWGMPADARNQQLDWHTPAEAEIELALRLVHSTPASACTLRIIRAKQR